LAESAFAGGNVGVVTPRRFIHPDAFVLKCGATLSGFELIYETYGELNTNASNAILICHALSGHHHAAGVHHPDDEKPGWWNTCIGPGKPIDTDRFYVIALNNIGGCHGSTGPCSMKPDGTGMYGPGFPVVSVEDWVRSQACLADHLGVRTFAAVIGGSLGGMQALHWTMEYPDRVRNAIVIAAAPKLTAQNIAFNEIARHAITSDPRFAGGHYRESGINPDVGLALARMIGHVTYLSASGMGKRFGRQIKSGDLRGGADVEFQVQSYLRYQGQTFSRQFDANTYVLMTRALDLYDPAAEFDDDLVKAVSRAKAAFLLVSFTSDWRFPVERSEEIVHALLRSRKNVSHAIIDSEHGHDSFLLPLPRYLDVLGTYLRRVHAETEANAT
jgi:homoserine O-acetyltransferase